MFGVILDLINGIIDNVNVRVFLYSLQNILFSFLLVQLQYWKLIFILWE